MRCKVWAKDRTLPIAAAGTALAVQDAPGGAPGLCKLTLPFRTVPDRIIQHHEAIPSCMIHTEKSTA